MGVGWVLVMRSVAAGGNAPHPRRFRTWAAQVASTVEATDMGRK